MSIVTMVHSLCNIGESLQESDDSEVCCSPLQMTTTTIRIPNSPCIDNFGHKKTWQHTAVSKTLCYHMVFLAQSSVRNSSWTLFDIPKADLETNLLISLWIFPLNSLSFTFRSFFDKIFFSFCSISAKNLNLLSKATWLNSVTSDMNLGSVIFSFGTGTTWRNFGGFFFELWPGLLFYRTIYGV